MAESKNTKEEETVTLKNLFKNQEELTPEELENLIDDLYSKEDNVDHSKEIASYRLPIRVSKGKNVIREELIEEWIEFATRYSNKTVPYNYELETILKYLVMIDEGIYNLNEIANMFIEEVREITSPEKVFIHTNIDKFAKTNISFSNLVKGIFEAKKNQTSNKSVLEVTNELIRLGISPREAEILANAKIAKLIENGHEIAELMVFDNGSKEGVDNEGNWIFIEEVTTSNNRHFQIIFKTSHGEQMRYIIDKDTDIALATNKDGSFKDKITMCVETIICDDMNAKTLIETIDNIVTEIAVIDMSHDEAYATTREIIELINPSSEDAKTLKVEDIYDQEIPRLKKTHQ